MWTKALTGERRRSLRSAGQATLWTPRAWAWHDPMGRLNAGALCPGWGERQPGQQSLGPAGVGGEGREGHAVGVVRFELHGLGPLHRKAPCRALSRPPGRDGGLGGVGAPE